ncbi:unnamed protein product [Schistocephalus solidus]|uniref:C2H2-type domain-containing protein n=1 Tax=Schistocephalus solidus TaxID=70667 RepID=A0A183SRG2_SCHSO|nr:unnamed protein product [Schistocephalus solidus]
MQLKQDVHHTVSSVELQAGTSNAANCNAKRITHAGYHLPQYQHQWERSQIPNTHYHHPSPPTTNNADSIPTFAHFDFTLASLIGLIGHLRIHPTETYAPGPEIPVFTHHHFIKCLHIPRIFRHCMSLLSRMRNCGSASHRNVNFESSACTSDNSLPSGSASPPSISVATTSSITTTIKLAAVNLFCPCCHRACTSCSGLGAHLRTQRTKTGRPGPMAPTHTIAIASTAALAMDS